MGDDYADRLKGLRSSNKKLADGVERIINSCVPSISSAAPNSPELVLTFETYDDPKFTPPAANCFKSNNKTEGDGKVQQEKLRVDIPDSSRPGPSTEPITPTEPEKDPDTLSEFWTKVFEEQWSKDKLEAEERAKAEMSNENGQNGEAKDKTNTIETDGSPDDLIIDLTPPKKNKTYERRNKRSGGDSKQIDSVTNTKDIAGTAADKKPADKKPAETTTEETKNLEKHVHYKKKCVQFKEQRDATTATDNVKTSPNKQLKKKKIPIADFKEINVLKPLAQAASTILERQLTLGREENSQSNAANSSGAANSQNKRCDTKNIKSPKVSPAKKPEEDDEIPIPLQVTIEKYPYKTSCSKSSFAAATASYANQGTSSGPETVERNGGPPVTRSASKRKSASTSQDKIITKRMRLGDKYNFTFYSYNEDSVDLTCRSYALSLKALNPMLMREGISRIMELLFDLEDRNLMLEEIDSDDEDDDPDTSTE